MQSIIEKLRTEANRRSTDKVYYQIWKIFNEFIIKLDHKPKTWEDRLALFVGYLIECKRKSNTIKSYISAIKSVLSKDGVSINENRFLLSSLTKACKITNDRVKTILPIRKGLMQLLLDTVPQLYNNPQLYLVTLYQTMICTAYFGLFRVGEIAWLDHTVKAADMHIGVNKDKVMFVLHTSKTHGRDRKPQIIKIDSEIIQSKSTKTVTSEREIGPFALLRTYTKVRKKFITINEPFFRWFKFTLKPPYTITHGNLLSAIWDTSHWTSFVKFGLKTA